MFDFPERAEAKVKNVEAASGVGRILGDGERERERAICLWAENFVHNVLFL